MNIENFDFIIQNINDKLNLETDKHKEIIKKIDKIEDSLNKMLLKINKLEVYYDKINIIDDIDKRTTLLENSDKGIKKMIPVLVALLLLFIERFLNV